MSDHIEMMIANAERAYERGLISEKEMWEAIDAAIASQDERE